MSGLSLKKECKAAITQVYKSDGTPMITDKNFITFWENFAKSQPNLTTVGGATFSGEGLSGVPPPKIWETLANTLEKFGIEKKFCPKIVTILKKKFGETPTMAEIAAFMSA